MSNLPPLYGYCSDNGKGHFARISAVVTEWRKRGGEAEIKQVGDYRVKKNHVLVTDFHHSESFNRMPSTIFHAGFNDNNFLLHSNEDAIINVGYYERIYGENPYKYAFKSGKPDLWCGLHYWPTNIAPKETSRDRFVLVIPGSASYISEGFIINQIEKEVSRWGFNTIVARDMPKERYIDLLSRARFVVSAASNSALEALLFNKPTMLIQTSMDQFYIYNTLIQTSWHATPFTGIGIDHLLMKPPPVDSGVDCCGATRIVNNILEEIQ